MTEYQRSLFLMSGLTFGSGRLADYPELLDAVIEEAREPLLAQLAATTERAERAEAALRELADHHGKEHTSVAGCSLVDIHVNRALAARSLLADEPER